MIHVICDFDYVVLSDNLQVFLRNILIELCDFFIIAGGERPREDDGGEELLRPGGACRVSGWKGQGQRADKDKVW